MNAQIFTVECMLACNIGGTGKAARGAASSSIISMAADTRTKDQDWPLLLPPPPKFNVPPPPIPAFVEACRHQQEQDSTVRHYGGTCFQMAFYLFIIIYY